MMVALAIVIVVGVYPGLAALPQFRGTNFLFSSTLPITSGPYDDKVLQTIAKFQMATIDKAMGHLSRGVTYCLLKY